MDITSAPVYMDDALGRGAARGGAERRAAHSNADEMEPKPAAPAGRWARCGRPGLSWAIRGSRPNPIRAVAGEWDAADA